MTKMTTPANATRGRILVRERFRFGAGAGAGKVKAQCRTKSASFTIAANGTKKNNPQIVPTA